MAIAGDDELGIKWSGCGISYDGAVKTSEKRYKKGVLLEKDTLHRKAVDLFQSKLAD